MSDIIYQGARKVRKPRHCWGCAKQYPVGTVMGYSVSVDCGSIASAYWCDECEKYMTTLSNDDRSYLSEGVDYGDIKRMKEES